LRTIPWALTPFSQLAGAPFVEVSANGPPDGADFGLENDTTGTNGIQDAINSIASTGGRIYLKYTPNGYSIGNHRIVFPNNGSNSVTFWVEAEVPGTTIYATGPGSGSFVGVMSAYDGASGSYPNVFFKNITISQAWNATNGAPDSAFNFTYGKTMWWEQCTATVTGAPSNYPSSAAGGAGFVTSKGLASAKMALIGCGANNMSRGFDVAAHTLLSECRDNECNIGVNLLATSSGTQTYQDHPVYLNNHDSVTPKSMIAYAQGASGSSPEGPCLLEGWLTFENQESGSYQTSYVVNDPSNNIYGKLFILGHALGNTAASGYDNFKTVNGAANLELVPLLARGIRATYSQKSKSALVSNFVNFTPILPLAGAYKLSVQVNVQTAAAVNMDVTLGYTDAQGNAQSFKLPLFAAGSATPVIEMNNTTGVFFGSILFQTDNSQTPILCSTTGTTQTAYDLAATLEQVA
jgi:hypothetical protein